MGSTWIRAKPAVEHWDSKADDSGGADATIDHSDIRRWERMVLANSDQIDKLGVAVLPSISF
jgi:hypothetical protein